MPHGGDSVRNKIYKSDRNALLETGKQLLLDNDDYLFGFRVTLVNMVLAGHEASEIATHGGIELRSLQRWVKNVDEANSFDVLRPKRPTGRPNKLTTAQKAELKAVLTSDPLDYGYNVWEGKTVSSYINSVYGVELKVRSCQKLMHELGFSLIRPQPHPNHEPNQTPREEFKKN